MGFFFLGCSFSIVTPLDLSLFCGRIFCLMCVMRMENQQGRSGDPKNVIFVLWDFLVPRVYSLCNLSLCLCLRLVCLSPLPVRMVSRVLSAMESLENVRGQKWKLEWSAAFWAGALPVCDRVPEWIVIE
ncbi:hypothetical protein BCR34DRAFT_140564 [Clohesyomyces aquaticus]|uniref:Uncharacterized protein n=1 Tax=Clohesyomyces aquaticus TaxID=1231657 RepID=A0A1Y1YMI1_9PLEO|nr:hypothetical protein BCR34DRAFT_140564 [Clohesyomyces aquaticus]